MMTRGRVRYLHSDIEILERVVIIRDPTVVLDVLIGIIYYERSDIPEVGLVAISDADKEGF